MGNGEEYEKRLSKTFDEHKNKSESVNGTNILRQSQSFVQMSLLAVLLTQYCSGDQTEKSEIGGACSMYGERRGLYRVLAGKPEGKRL